MHKVIIVGKVKQAVLRFTQTGKPVFNVKVADFSQDKNEVWHGANFEMAWWNEEAEKMADKIIDGQVYIFEGSIDKINTFETKNGETGASVVLNFPKWQFIPRTGEGISATDVEGAVVTENVGYGS